MDVTYKLPADFLASLAFEFDGNQFLFAIANTFAIRAPGDHQIFPYCVSGNRVPTRSTERTSAGTLTFGGLLAGDLTLMRSLIFEKLGNIQTSGVRFRMSDMESGISLMHILLMDFRIGSVELASSMFGNTTMVGGNFGITFRDMSRLPY